MLGRKPHVSSLFTGLDDNAQICAKCYDGYVTISVDDNCLFEGTLTDSLVVFASLVGLMGKKTAKCILKMKGLD